MPKYYLIQRNGGIIKAESVFPDGFSHVSSFDMVLGPDPTDVSTPENPINMKKWDNVEQHIRDATAQEMSDFSTKLAEDRITKGRARARALLDDPNFGKIFKSIIDVFVGEMNLVRKQLDRMRADLAGAKNMSDISMAATSWDPQQSGPSVRRWTPKTLSQLQTDITDRITTGGETD